MKAIPELSKIKYGRVENMGVKPVDLGMHSNRKGIGTMVAARYIVSPPIISVCVRI